MTVISLVGVVVVISSSVLLLALAATTSLVRCVLREEDRHARLHILRKSQQADHICLNLRRDTVIEAMTEPNKKLINPANGKHDTSDFVVQFELLSDERQDEILPNLVSIALGELKAEGCTLTMLVHFPNWLDALLENVDRRALRHLIWAL